MTLIELLVAIILVAIILVAAFGVYSFYLAQIELNLKRSNARMQIDYALENIKLRCQSAIDVNNTFFTQSALVNLTQIRVFTDRDLSSITPNDSSDNSEYWFHLVNGNLVMWNNFTNTAETLIDSQFTPAINFTWTTGTEPNFMTVNIEAGPRDGRVRKIEGIRFWFLDIAR